jgi:hypothetical protein
VRSFRVDRIGRPLTTGASFPPREPPDADLAAYFSRSVSSGAYAVQARVIFHAPLERMQREISPSAGFLERIHHDVQCSVEVGEFDLHIGVRDSSECIQLGAAARHTADVGWLEN